MGSGVGEIETVRNRKLLLGIGYLVQGLRCFPWMGVNFFLKDGLRVEPSTLQILQNSANLPMVAKPFYGILSDSYYILGQHRVPYIALGAFLQAISWVSIALFGVSFFSVTLYLLLGNLGASIVEVANDAMVAETAKQSSSPPSKNAKHSSSSGGLQSFTWMASSIGGVLGNLVGGLAIDKSSPRAMFLLYGILLSVQFLTTLFIHESSLNLPKNPSRSGFKKQLSELKETLKKPEILYSILWFTLSYSIIPALTGTMFYYQTEHLKIESSLLGISKVVGQAAMLLWGAVYNRKLKSISSRKLIVAVQIAMSAFVVSDYLFVKGVYRGVGVSDSYYVVLFSGLLEVLYFFKILPFTVLMAQLCPPGCEGSIMAFVMSAIALAFIVSGYLGVLLASLCGVSGDDFSGLTKGLLVQAACTVLPVFWASWVADDAQKGSAKVKKED